MECLICIEKYDTSYVKPVFGRCGHSICRFCAQKIEHRTHLGPTCPVCMLPDAFTDFRLNWDCLDVLVEMQSKKELEDKKFSLEIDGVPTEFVKCAGCGDVVEEDRARVCKTCFAESGFIPVNDTELVINKRKLDDAIVCASCFLEGKHKGHQSELWLPLKNDGVTLRDRDSMSCRVCKERFDHTEHVPIIGSCGHSVCRLCVRNARDSGSIACPKCDQSHAFADAPNNFQMLDMLVEVTSAALQDMDIRNSTQLTATDFIECHQCSGFVEKERIRICVDCCWTNKTIEILGRLGETKMAVNMPELDASILCSSCFLSGPHKGHKSSFWHPLHARHADVKYAAALAKVKNSPRSRLYEKFNGLLTSLNALEESSSPSDEIRSAPGLSGCRQTIERCLQQIEVNGQLDPHLLMQFNQRLTMMEKCRRFTIVQLQIAPSTNN